MGHNKLAVYRVTRRVAQHQLILKHMERYLQQYEQIHQDILSAALDNPTAHELYFTPTPTQFQIQVHAPVRTNLTLHYPKSWACMSDLLELELLPQLEAALPLVKFELSFDLEDERLLQETETAD